MLNKDYVFPKNQLLKDDEFKSKDFAEHVFIKCIVCGRKTKNGNLFCLQCYHKYKEKKLLVKIVKCKEIEIMD